MIENFWLFALSAFLLNITPGNDMLYIIARSSSQGTKAGIISSFGIMAGGLVHTTAAVIGLSALIAESALAFNIIKFIGAGYLVYLGIKALVTRNKIIDQKVEKKAIPNKRLFIQGALTNILNPKVALFFLAFLPQFINVHTGNVPLSIMFLGIWFNIGGTIVNILVAILFGKIGKLLSSSPRIIYWQGKFTGIILLGLGIKVAIGTKK